MSAAITSQYQKMYIPMLTLQRTTKKLENP
jgi:hypothetical protein